MCLLHLLRTAFLIDKDEAGALAGLADEGHLPQLSLHHPFEMAVQETIDEEDVEGPLMVGDDDVALLGIHVLATLDVNGEEEQTNHDNGP